MTQAEVFGKLKKIIVESLDVEEDLVTLDASFSDDFGADSLEIVEFVMNLEEVFGIEIPDTDAEKITTVRSAMEYACARLGIAEGAAD